MSDFKFPDVGEGITEGKLISWKVSEGDEVANDQVLCEVETDKAVVEIPSPQAGKVTKLHGEEGDVLHVGEPLVTFDGADAPAESAPEKTASEPSEKPSEDKPLKHPPEHPQTPPDSDHWRAPERGTEQVESTLAPKAPKPEHHEPPASPPPRADDTQGPATEHPDRVLATPSTRRYAREKGVDISSLKGSGPHGRVTRADVDGASGGAPAEPATAPAPASASQPAQPQAPKPQESAPAPKPSAPAATGAIPYDGRRKAIGDHVTASAAVPTFTEFAEADITLLVELREHYKSKAQEQGVKLTYLPLFAKAVCSALHKHPALNAHFKGDSIERFAGVHLGIAADTDKGLIVPVVQDADRKSVLELAQEINALAQSAKGDDLSGLTLQGSTFSISSIGRSRVEGFTVMLNTPEVAILGIGGIQDKPRVVNGVVVPRKTVTFSLTVDHRAVDGADAAKFLSDIVALVEDPELFVLEGV